MKFIDIYTKKLCEDYRDNPNNYTRTIDRTIEVELELLRKGITRKDHPVLMATCKDYGISPRYFEIKAAISGVNNDN